MDSVQKGVGSTNQLIDELTLMNKMVITLEMILGLIGVTFAQEEASNLVSESDTFLDGFN